MTSTSDRTDPTQADSRPQRLSGRLNQAVDVATATGITVLIVVGFATSYRTLRDLAVVQGGYPLWLAPAVPLSFDLGIVVLSLKVIRAAREGRSAPVMRLLVAALSTATVVANASAAGTLTAQLLHAVPPAMFVICFESVVVTARRRALTRMGLVPEPLPRLRIAQWLLAPRVSWRAWRELVLNDRTVTAGHPNPDPPATSASAEDAAITAGPRRSARRRPARRTAPARSTGPIDKRLGSRSDDKDRIGLVRDLLQTDPTIAAPAIADHLAQHGHAVSVRTAQRLRARVTQAPDLGDPSESREALKMIVSG